MKIMSQNVKIAVCVCVYFIVLYHVVENYVWFPTSYIGLRWQSVCESRCSRSIIEKKTSKHQSSISVL